MKPRYVIPLADENASIDLVGGKGASLARLIRARFPVPDGFHVTTAAYRSFVAQNQLHSQILIALKDVNASDPSTLNAASQRIQQIINDGTIPEDIIVAVAEAYEQLVGDRPKVAVRSSATAEDLPDFSFAGQQETFLNIEGTGELLQAIRRCWASLWTARAIGYRARNKIDSKKLSLAVVVQLMISAEASGILFTANPVNGRRDQAVINAAWGLGEAIVGGEVTPDTFTIDKEHLRVIARNVANKQRMTVGQTNGTTISPVPEGLRKAAVLEDGRALQLVGIGQQIETLFGGPVDIEWTSFGGQFQIVQARPITALREPEVEPPAEWPLPGGEGKYIRASIIDFMPDPLSPLFGTMGVKALNVGMIRLCRRLTNSEPVFPEDTIQLINDYAYMRINYTSRQWWWLLTRLGMSFPRMLRTGLSYWRDQARPSYLAATNYWRNQDPTELTSRAILEGVEELLEVAVDHLGALMAGTMGVSAGSEGLFTKLYLKLIKKEGDPDAPTFLMGYNSTPIRAEKSLYDLASWCHEQSDLAAYLLQTPSKFLGDFITDGKEPIGVDSDIWHAFKVKFQDHLDAFGHIIYDLDFAQPLPADDPATMLDTCKMYLQGLGQNPHNRQQSLALNRVESSERIRKRLRGLKRMIFDKSLSWAQSLAEVREDGIADIGLGYPVIRHMLREIGRRFVENGAIDQSDDIFWLTDDEVDRTIGALDRHEIASCFNEQVRQRKTLLRAEKRVVPPPQLPAGAKYLGLSTEIWTQVKVEGQSGNVIKGLGASPGHVIAPACVLNGPEDFEEFNVGEVLVASITTPAWTPLFARASAIVTDIGGPLSHGSIVAREYGIPAVLGTGVATHRIRNGQLITVDGDSGLVILPDGELAEIND